MIIRLAIRGSEGGITVATHAYLDQLLLGSD